MTSIVSRRIGTCRINNYAPGVRDKKKEELDKWGGPVARRELQAIYTIAFLCLLRSDEVLKIRREHLVLSDPVDGEIPTVTLTLPFRKTHQDGGM